MKKLFAFCMALFLLLLCTACGGRNQEIHVITREEGSGTRSAFVELTGVEEDGVDKTTLAAEVCSSTAVVLQTVAGNESAIGYLSLGSLSSNVKALKINGVAPSAQTVKDGSYALARPFLMVTDDSLSEAAQDFLTFVLSDRGQAVISQEGYVPVGDGAEFVNTHVKGTVLVAGSSSVAPVMEKLAEAYMAVNDQAVVQVSISDSSTGISSVADGLCDLAMSSRSLKDSESAKGLAPHTLCMDGIAVIVHTENAVSDLTLEQLRDIFTGKCADWSELA